MTTLGLGLVFLAILMIYCGVKGKSLSAAVVGHAVDTTSGSLISGSGGGSTNTQTSSPASSSSAGRSLTGPAPTL